MGVSERRLKTMLNPKSYTITVCHPNIPRAGARIDLLIRRARMVTQSYASKTFSG